MGDLHETDVLEWSEQQAALLRRRAAGELVDEHELDHSSGRQVLLLAGVNTVTGSRSVMRSLPAAVGFCRDGLG